MVLIMCTSFGSSFPKVGLSLFLQCFFHPNSMRWILNQPIPYLGFFPLKIQEKHSIGISFHTMYRVEPSLKGNCSFKIVGRDLSFFLHDTLNVPFMIEPGT